MIILKFKDVGQGDSIIISWEDKAIKKIGIVDCHKCFGKNVIIDELEQIEGDYEIEFIILSHGHKDHYSGIIDLLKYCEKKSIVINNFTSTLQPSQYEFLNITRTLGELKTINKLLEIIELFYNKGVILELFPTYNKITNFSIEGFVFECIYPRQRDYTTLSRKLDKFVNKKVNTKPDLNEIATIFKLRNDASYVLLTSDCTIESLQYIERVDVDLQRNQLTLTQVPHHGSIKNHNEIFWKNRIIEEKCPAIISVGDSVHNLPNEEVVSSFKKIGYEIYSTNYVNGIKSYIEGVEVEKDYSFALDLFSSSSEQYQHTNKNDRFTGDKVFKIDNTNVEYQQL